MNGSEKTSVPKPCRSSGLSPGVAAGIATNRAAGVCLTRLSLNAPRNCVTVRPQNEESARKRRQRLAVEAGPCRILREDFRFRCGLRRLIRIVGQARFSISSRLWPLLNTRRLVCIIRRFSFLAWPARLELKAGLSAGAGNSQAEYGLRFEQRRSAHSKCPPIPR